RLSRSLLISPSSPSIYSLSLHDALPILSMECLHGDAAFIGDMAGTGFRRVARNPGDLAPLDTDRRQDPPGAKSLGQPLLACHAVDRKSTRLNSSHVKISYAVFCLKKKKT